MRYWLFKQTNLLLPPLIALPFSPTPQSVPISFTSMIRSFSKIFQASIILVDIFTLEHKQILPKESTRIRHRQLSEMNIRLVFIHGFYSLLSRGSLLCLFVLHAWISQSVCLLFSAWYNAWSISSHLSK